MNLQFVFRAFTAAMLCVACAQSYAQRDIAGMWVPLHHNQDGDGMIGDSAGVPLTEDGRKRGDSWSPEEFDMAEWVCRPHAWDYSLETTHSEIRFRPIVDGPTQDVVAYQGHITMQGQETVIWMDGRPRPPRDALHTWSGFTTGEWDGDALVTTTTHLKEAYIRRWGLIRSDQATVRTRWRRIGDYLQATVIIYDPVYLSEPYVRSTLVWLSDPAYKMAPYPCEEATETALPRGEVAHFLPGKSPLPGLDPSVDDPFETPYAARLGGALTMYPDYIASMRAMRGPKTAAESSLPSGSRIAPDWLPPLEAPRPGEVQAVPVRDGIYMLTGAGGNVTVQVGDDGVLLVDTGRADMAEKTLAAIRAIDEGPLRYIINTTEASDHVGGNSVIAAAGETIPWRDFDTGSGGTVQGAFDTHRASVVAYLSVFDRMASPPEGRKPAPEAAWPDNTYSTPWKRLHFNGEPVFITHRVANTDGNSVVLFRRSDVISAGDLLDLTGFPVIDVDAGGSIQAIVDSLNYLISITAPAIASEGGTLVIPGRGRIADHADVVYYRDMVTVVRDRIADMIGRRLSLEQVKASDPTQGYNARYGRTSGTWTTDMFVEAAYRSLLHTLGETS